MILTNHGKKRRMSQASFEAVRRDTEIQRRETAKLRAATPDPFHPMKSSALFGKGRAARGHFKP